MQKSKRIEATILGLFIFLGLSTLGHFVASAILDFKNFERAVRVKGLAEREVPADIVIWPIQFSIAENDLQKLYKNVEESTSEIRIFLIRQGITEEEITISPPAIKDKTAESYGGTNSIRFRYTASQTVTVYSKNISTIRMVMGNLNQLGKKGIAFTGYGYETKPEYIFTGLNRIKPEMIEDATNNAREVARKFAEDSRSTLGKIKGASQG